MEKRSKKDDFFIINTQTNGNRTSERYYADQQHSSSNQEPSFVMYEILRSIIRGQLRQPFKKIQYSIHDISEPRAKSKSIRQRPKHLQYQLEIIQENIERVCKRVMGNNLRDGFQSIVQHIQMNKLMKKQCFTSENIAKLNFSIAITQGRNRKNLKRLAFKHIKQSVKLHDLSKLSGSKSRSFSKQLNLKEVRQMDDYKPYFTERSKQIEAVDSYIIQKGQKSSQYSGKRIQRSQKNVQNTTVPKHTEPISSFQSIQRHFQSTERQKSKKGTSIFKDLKEVNERDQLQNKVFNTYRKQNQQNHLQYSKNNHHIFVIKDYRKRQSSPNNFIKIPVQNINTNIIQLQTTRKKKNKKQYQQKQQSQIQQQICLNCKFCIMTRQRKAAMQHIQQKYHQSTSFFSTYS